jgi:8-oxo-dGTP diphosphatase
MAATVRVGVGVILQDGTGKVLVGRRMGSHGAGRLALPGGHLEMGESFELCAARELLEETGVAIDEHRFEQAAVTNDPMPSEGKHYVTIFMRADLPPGAVATNCEPHKNAGWEWMSWGELERTSSKDFFIPLQNLIVSAYRPPLPTPSS